MIRNKQDLFAILTVSIVLGCRCLGQVQAHDVPRVEIRTSFHGLTLSLSQDAAEPPDSQELRSCLATHPSLACVPLTLILKNDNPQTVVTWGLVSCVDLEPRIDFQQADGTWVAFPYSPDYLPFRTCNIIGKVEIFPHGDSRVLKFRLASPSLGLDATYQLGDQEFVARRCFGCEWLDARAPHLIRAQVGFSACVAARKLKPTDTFNSFDQRSICVSGKESTPTLLVSNELPLHQ